MASWEASGLGLEGSWILQYAISSFQNMETWTKDNIITLYA